jgi:hypothetical protein
MDTTTGKIFCIFNAILRSVRFPRWWFRNPICMILPESQVDDGMDEPCSPATLDKKFTQAYMLSI